MSRLMMWLRAANRQQLVPLEDSPDRAFLMQLPIAWFWMMGWLTAGICALVLRWAEGTLFGAAQNGWNGDVVILGLFVGAVGAWLLHVAHPDRWPYRWQGVLPPLAALVFGSIYVAVPCPVAGVCVVVGVIPLCGYLTYTLPPVASRALPPCVACVVGLGALLPAAPALGQGRLGMILVLGLFVGVTLLIKGSEWIWRESMHVAVSARRAQFLDRRRAYATFDSVLHDGALALLERVAAGQPIDEPGRLEAAQMAATARRRFLGDDRPRMVAQLIDDAAAKAAAHGIVLVRVAYIEAEPPPHVLEAVADALGALIVNLRHAKVDSARISVDSDGRSLTVSLVDDGIGRASGAEWGPSVRRRVFQRLEQIGGTAEVESELSRGTIWRLQWHQK